MNEQHAYGVVLELGKALQRVVYTLVDAKCYNKSSKLGGLCELVQNQLPKAENGESLALFFHLLDHWPGRAVGSGAYPVPHPIKNGLDAFYDAKDRWYAAEDASWEDRAYVYARWKLYSYMKESCSNLRAALKFHGELEAAKATVKATMQRLKDHPDKASLLFGLCYALYNSSRNDIKLYPVADVLLSSLMSSWQKHSGNHRFPVPAPEGSKFLVNSSKMEAAELVWGDGSKTYVGEYGALRMELVDHVLANVDAASTLWVTPLPPVLRVPKPSASWEPV